MRAKGSRAKLIAAGAVLAAAAAFLAFLAWGRNGNRPPPNGNGGNGGERPVPAGKLEKLAARLPESTVFLLASEDLGKLATGLREGPLGKIALSKGVRGFLAALKREPLGESASLTDALKVGLALAWQADGPGALVLWELGGQRGPALGLAARVRPERAERCLKIVASILAAPGEKIRDVPAGPGAMVRTLAPAGREGTAWGLSGSWVAVADSVAGCRELLGAVGEGGKPGGAHPRMKGALKAAGPGLLVGYAEMGRAIPASAAEALGMKRIEWAGYSASPLDAGRWSERLVLGGGESGGGLPAALAAGGKRELLAALPASTLACARCNVGDGARLWAGIGKSLAPLDHGGLVKQVAARIGAAAGRDFEREVAPLVRGELVAAWMLPRQGCFPQCLVGVSLAPGGAGKLSPRADRVLELPWFGTGGRVESAEYRSVRLAWLGGQKPAHPMYPSPSYAFRGDRLLAASSSICVKEFLSGRGGKWLSEKEARRLSSGLLGVRVSLERALPFLSGWATDSGLRERLGAGHKEALPMPEEIAGHLGELELVAGRCPEGLGLDIRGPFPLLPAAAGALLLAE